ncbi:MAG: translation initiation factor [Bacteroidales bacterium]|nr:translation initiation factor [Bacteroidales bacterium]
MMAQKDWKEILNTTLTSIPQTDAKEPIPEDSKKTPEIRQDLIIRFEKRNGKPATIISNFQGSEEKLKDLAAKIKKLCGVGGSAKDDEILIQGDVRKKVADFLRKQGNSVRGDIK